MLSPSKAPVGRGLTFVPGNVETRIRPITGRHSLLPTSQARTFISSPYGSPSLAGENTGLPRSAPEVCAGLGTCCRPGSSIDHEVAPLNPPPASVPFGSSLSATLASCSMTVVAQVHMCLPYPLPSHRPACGCQESRSLAVPTPHAYTCLCTLSGPLFIQAPRFTRWYGWSSIKSDDEDNFISDLVSQQRLALQRAPAASRRRSSKPPTAAGHHGRESLRRPLQALVGPACSCLNCTMLRMASRQRADPDRGLQKP